MDAAVRKSEPPTSSKPSLGKYAVVRELGEGGMAQVFEGRHPELGSAVALKVLRPAVAAQPQAAARFLREAQASAQICHPNIVRVFDIGMEGDIPFIVMELLEGADLATMLAAKGALGLGSTVELFLPVISAVSTAHAAGIVHRDLKPANLMLTRRPPRGQHPVVLDFGISKMINEEGDGTLTRSESLLGTVQYMAPELTRGAKFASTQSDQYALGVMLYECATGRRPFSGASPYEVMHAIVTSPVEPPSRANRSLPKEFDEIVLRAMAREPGRRFPTVHALGRALLSLGDQASWNLWGREYLEEEAGRDLWSCEMATMADDPTAFSRRTFPARERFRRGRLRPTLAYPLVAYGAVATWFLAHPSAVPMGETTSTIAAVRAESVSRPSDAPPSISSSTEVWSGTAPASSKATESNRLGTPQTSLASSLLASTGADIALQVPAQILDRPGSSLKESVPSKHVRTASPSSNPASTNGTSITPMAPSHVGDASKPSPQLGTNGAFIID